MMQLLTIYTFWIVKVGITLNCYGFNVSFDLPNIDYKYHIDNYEEGAFYDFIFKDTTAITIHCGTNVVRPSVNEGVLSEENLEVRGQKILRRRGTEKDGVHLWQEDIYVGLNLSIFIRNASPDTYGNYETILSNAEIDPIKQEK